MLYPSRASLLCAAVALSLVLAAGARGQDQPTGESVMDNYIKAIGGQEAQEKIKSTVAKGTIKLQGLEGKLTIYEKAPKLRYLEFTLPNIGTFSTGTDGKIVWENNPITGARLKTGREAEAFLREADSASTLKWRDYYKDAKLAGEEQVDGKPAYKVILTDKKGEKETRYFAKNSGLLVRLQMKVESAMGELEVEANIGGYKKIAGVLIPTRISQSVLGQSIDMQLDEIEPNADIPDSRFALPDAVKELLKKDG